MRAGDGRFLALLAGGVGLAVAFAAAGALPTGTAAGLVLLWLVLGALWLVLR